MWMSFVVGYVFRRLLVKNFPANLVQSKKQNGKWHHYLNIIDEICLRWQYKLVIVSFMLLQK